MLTYKHDQQAVHQVTEIVKEPNKPQMSCTHTARYQLVSNASCGR